MPTYDCIGRQLRGDVHDQRGRVRLGEPVLRASGLELLCALLSPITLDCSGAGSL